MGAGTGSYSQVLAEQNHTVLAVEPSAKMRSQAIANPNIQWLDAEAEHLPLADQSADAAIIMLAFHHFHNPRKALQEVSRVVGNGSIVLFTYDPDAIANFWLTQYFPSLITDVKTTFMTITALMKALEQITHQQVVVSPFPLPHNLFDSFAAVGWSRPELYLDPDVRNGISSFAKMNEKDLTKGLESLLKDLENGTWDNKYGPLRQQRQKEVGYCFVNTLP